MGSFWILIKKFGIIFSIIFFGCSSNKPVAQLEAYDDLDFIRKNLKEQRIEIDSMKQQLSYYKQIIDDQSYVLEVYNENNNELRQFKLSLENDVNNAISILNDNSINSDFTSEINKINRKNQILEDRTFYTDSLYFEIVNDIVEIENKISSLIASFKEMNDISSGARKKIVIPKISDEEYKAKYIEALSFYQNSEWNLSLDGFRYLLQADMNHELSDNCQYWLGEIFYALTDYRRSIEEFRKVFSFSGTNKADDSYYKLGLCYVNIGQYDNAKVELSNLIKFFPDSEYYKRAEELLNKY
tara:strand:- start:2240 stop:3136 length:897 start_codon:yes stop_codon:yes gene_type:complete